MNGDLAYWQNERRQLYSAQAYWTAKLNEPRNGNPYYHQDLDLALARLREISGNIIAVENQIDVILSELA